MSPFLDENILAFQLLKVIDDKLLFMLRIHKKLLFQTFHFGVQFYNRSQSKNHMNTVETWPILNGIIRYLNSMAFVHKKDILSQ